MQTFPEESYEPVDNAQHRTSVQAGKDKQGKKTKYGASGSLLGKSYMMARGKKSKKSGAHNGKSDPYNIPTQRWLDESAAEEPFRGFTTPQTGNGSSLTQGNDSANTEYPNGE